jgi:hypothetical protein
MRFDWRRVYVEIEFIAQAKAVCACFSDERANVVSGKDAIVSADVAKAP